MTDIVIHRTATANSCAAAWPFAFKLNLGTPCLLRPVVATSNFFRGHKLKTFGYC